MKPISAECPDIQAQLPLYVGGDLESPAATDLVRRHVAACAVCAGELTRLKSALDAIGALRAERLPEIDVWSAVRAELVGSGLIRAPVAVADVAPRVETAPAAPVRMRLVPRVWRYAAAAVFVFGAGLALWNLAGAPSGSSDSGNSDVASRDVVTPAVSATPVSDGTGGIELVDAPAIPAGETLQPTLIESNGLHKVGADEEPLWRSARPFGVPYGVRRPQSAWQAASYPVLPDPRVR